MQQTGVVKYMYSEAEIENMKLKDIKPVLKMYGVSVNKPVKELRLLLKSLECETMEEKMLKRKLTFFKRYRNSGFSDPVKRYKTSFNMVDRLDALLGYIPYQWRHSCAANAWFLWFIRVAVVFSYGCWDSFGEDLGRRREHPQQAHHGDCLKSFMKFVLIEEMVKMEEITHRVEEEATIRVLRQTKGASETQRSSSDCSKQAKEKVKKEKEAEKKRKCQEYNQQVYRRIENIKKDCEEAIAAKRAKLEKRVAALTEAMATCKTEKGKKGKEEMIKRGSESAEKCISSMKQTRDNRISAEEEKLYPEDGESAF